MFSMIQSTSKKNRNSIIRLAPGSYVSPAGYVVGEYQIVLPVVTRDAALNLLARFFQRGEGVSLWWQGAVQDIADRINI